MAFQNEENAANKDSTVRLVTTFRELANQKELQLEEQLVLRMEEAKEYATLVQSIKPEEVKALEKDSNKETAENIKIADDGLSQMFGKGDFEKLSIIG